MMESWARRPGYTQAPYLQAVAALRRRSIDWNPAGPYSEYS